MSDISKWSHKDEWRQRGKDFLVSIVRHSVERCASFDYEGPHRWAVYAYIYPKHWMFGKFDGPHMWQPAASALPLHAGPSFLRWHLGDDGKPVSVQVGSDYHHLHDDYTNCATPEQAFIVFGDAQALFDYLSEAGASVDAEQSESEAA